MRFVATTLESVSLKAYFPLSTLIMRPVSASLLRNTWIYPFLLFDTRTASATVNTSSPRSLRRSMNSIDLTSAHISSDTKTFVLLF